MSATAEFDTCEWMTLKLQQCEKYYSRAWCLEVPFQRALMINLASYFSCNLRSEASDRKN